MPPFCSSRARLLVLGPGSDTAAVRLYAAALEGSAPPAGSADESRLRRALDALEDTLEAKRDEAEAFAEAAARRRQPAAPEAQLTEAEKLALGRYGVLRTPNTQKHAARACALTRPVRRGITSGLMMGVQGSIWSSFLRLFGALILLSLTAGGDGGAPPAP